MIPGGFAEISIHLSTSIYPSVHLSVCPCACALITLYIPCVQSAHLTQSDSRSTRCQMPSYNWDTRLFLNTEQCIVTVGHEPFTIPPLYLFIWWQDSTCWCSYSKLLFIYNWKSNILSYIYLYLFFHIFTVAVTNKMMAFHFSNMITFFSD